ncbi:MAG: hypothetical protein EXR72_13895 [Myxococcales bacterium]|nr:hypothetical protein [Myxococcales bacterium]
MIPAAAAPARDGLELSVTRLDGPVADRLLLGAGAGAVILALGPEVGKFIFIHGKLAIESAGGADGRAFVDEVARWLDLELAPASEGDAAESGAASAASTTWVRLGQGEDPFGVSWDSFKLFFSLGGRYAEVFLRLSGDGKRAQLIEKWSDYRETLVEILERLLAPAPPRKVQKRREAVQGPGGEMLFGVQGVFELAIPGGWLLTEQQGHWRLADPADERMIEFSCIRLPPLPPDAPDVAARLRSVIADSEYAASASPIATFERGGAAFAWSEHWFLSDDTNHPERARRPARGRWLLASNAWVQVLVTSCFWEEDFGVATAGWDSVVASLRLRGRAETPLTPDQQA